MRVQPRRDECTKSRAAADHEVTNVAVVDASETLRLDVGLPQLARMRKRREPPSEQRRAAPHSPRQHETAHLGEAEYERSRQHPEQRRSRIGLAEQTDTTARLRAHVSG